MRGAALEYCACGGVWLPYGEVEKVFGALKAELLGGETSRRCPDCTLTMTPVVWPGGVPVETCSTCRGTWLASVTGFQCVKCGARTEFAKGHATASGLVCGACVAVIQPMPRVPDLISALPDVDFDFDD